MPPWETSDCPALATSQLTGVEESRERPAETDEYMADLQPDFEMSIAAVVVAVALIILPFRRRRQPHNLGYITADGTPARLPKPIQESVEFPDELKITSEVIETMEGTSK